MSRQAIVIGGGFAGLTAAVALSDAGWRVAVLERRNGLGGRARSFVDPATGDIVDNGQHVFLGCYDATLKFLRRLGTADRVVFQQALEVSFAKPGAPLKTLRCPRVAGPWHLILGLAGFSGLSWLDKWHMLRVLRELSGRDRLPGELDDRTVDAWLNGLGQSPRSRRMFWDPLAIGALNDSPAESSALNFAAVVQRLAGADWRGARLGLASVGLSDLYTGEAARVIEARGGQIRLNTAVTGCELREDRMAAVQVGRGERVTADAFVSAVPPGELARLLPEDVFSREPRLRSLTQFTSSPIVSINLWLDRPVTDRPFVGMVGTQVQWLFNRAQLITKGRSEHVALVISAAGHLAGGPSDRVIEIALQDVQRCFPAARGAHVRRAQVVRESRGTIRTPVGSARWRPGPSTVWTNFAIAGDWTDTGLPATIESAVLSGYKAAEKLLAEDSLRALG